MTNLARKEYRPILLYYIILYYVYYIILYNIVSLLCNIRKTRSDPEYGKNETFKKKYPSEKRNSVRKLAHVV